MSRFRFWQLWLFYTSLLFALFGILFALYGNNYFFRFYNYALSQTFFNKPELSKQTDQFRAFIWGPLGGTIACCYLLLAFIAYYPFKRKEKWAYYSVCVAFGTWIIIDSAVCFLLPCIFSGLFNQCIFQFIIKMRPLIFTRKYFFK